LAYLWAQKVPSFTVGLHTILHCLCVGKMVTSSSATSRAKIKVTNQPWVNPVFLLHLHIGCNLMNIFVQDMHQKGREFFSSKFQ
jgi:hypothetical protein